jgi:two-component system, probable response regulator PhcQ
MRAVATILLIDDDPIVTAFLSPQFPTQRFKVLTASSAEEAYQLLEWHRLDVIVSDERMPGESGSEFLAAVRSKYPDITRIILTGHGSLESAVRAINEAEVYRFLLKPCNPADLISTIDQALDHKLLEAQSRNLLRQFRKQSAVLRALQHEHPELVIPRLEQAPAVPADHKGAAGLVDDLMREIEASMESERRWLASKPGGP